MAEGIERMTVLFGVDDTPVADGVIDRYVASTNVTEQEWSEGRVVAARVFLLVRSSQASSSYVNNNIYQGKFLPGWLVFTTSYGTATLGVVLMPLFLILNISLAMWCERIFRNAKGIEVRFLFIYLFARMALLPFVATPTLISFFTIQLFTIGLVFFVAIRLKWIDYPYTRKMSWT